MTTSSLVGRFLNEPYLQDPRLKLSALSVLSGNIKRVEEKHDDKATEHRIQGCVGEDKIYITQMP